MCFFLKRNRFNCNVQHLDHNFFFEYLYFFFQHGTGNTESGGSGLENTNFLLKKIDVCQSSTTPSVMYRPTKISYRNFLLKKCINRFHSITRLVLDKKMFKIYMQKSINWIKKLYKNWSSMEQKNLFQWIINRKRFL